jgi:hypothetical protein
MIGGSFSMAINEPGDAIAGSSTVCGCFPDEASTAAVGIS